MSEKVNFVKELSVNPDMVEYTVRARIYESIDEDGNVNYFAKFSHYYKPSEIAATTYHPSTVRGDMNSTEFIAQRYLDGFSGIDVEEDFNY